MALVPCKVCGSLNSDQAELCLSCGYPPNQSKRPAIFQWAAILVLAMLGIPLLLALFSRVQPQKQRSIPSDSTALQVRPQTKGHGRNHVPQGSTVEA